MFKDVFRHEWISQNGKWMVLVKVKEQTLSDGSKCFVSNVNVKSFVRDNVWRSENSNLKLPKYVAAELQKAKDLVDDFRKSKVST